MAYDASFLTGSDSTAVDPISSNYHHNEQAIASLNDEHIIIQIDDGKLINAMEAYDQTVELSSALKDSARRGEKMNDSSYRLLKISLGKIIKKSKIDFDDLPAMESLDKNTQRELTIVMENVVTDAIKSIWEKIKNTFIAMHNKIKTWFIKAFDGAGKLVKQAEALKAKAENMSSATAKNTSFEMSGVKFLSMGGKVASPQEIGAGVADIAGVTDVLLNKNAESYNKLFTQIEQSLKDTIEQAKAMKDSDATVKEKTEGEAKPETMNEAFSGNMVASGGAIGSATNSAGIRVQASGESNKLLGGIFSANFNMAKAAGIVVDTNKELKDERWSGGKLFAYRNPKEFLGGIMLVAAFPAGGVDTIESYADFKNGFKISPEPIINPPKELDDKGTFTTAPPALVIGICENTISSCNTLMQYKLLFEARDKNTGNLMKQMEQYVSANSNLKGIGQTHIKNSISTTVAIIKKQQDGETRWAKYAFSVLNKAILYCRNSLAQY